MDCVFSEPVHVVVRRSLLSSHSYLVYQAVHSGRNTASSGRGAWTHGLHLLRLSLVHALLQRLVAMCYQTKA